MRVFVFSTFLFLLTALTLSPGLAQDNILFEHLTIEDGLSQNSVTCMLQDSRGYMWLGTNHGLNLYDGYNITVFTHNAFDIGTLSDNWITVIYEDSDGIFWIGTKDGGLNRFDRREGTFKRFMHDPEDENTISSNSIVSAFDDRNRTLWIVTEDAGLNKYDRDTDTFQHIKSIPGRKNSLSSNNIIDICYDLEANTLWIGTEDSGLDRFDLETGESISFKHIPGRQNSLSSNSVTSVLKDSKGNLWIGTRRGGLNKLDTDTGVFNRFQNRSGNTGSISGNTIFSIFEDSDNTIWIGTEYQGLNKLENDGNFRNYRHNPGNSWSIGSNTVRVIFEDRSGILWFGTDGGGASKFIRNKVKFEMERHETDNINTLSYNNIWTFFETEDNLLWVGTNGGGLNRIDRQTNIYRHYHHDPDDPESISNDVVNCIEQGEDGFLWIGTDDGLNRLDIANETFEVFKNNPDDPESLFFNNISHMLKDSLGNFWVATWGGGFGYLNTTGNTFSEHLNDPDDPNSLHNEKIISLYAAGNGNIFITTNGGGLVKYDIKNGNYKRYRNDPENPESISNNKVSYICRCTETGRLFVGTFGGGLNIFNPNDEVFHHFTVKEGLPDDMIYGILEDNKQKFWISTNDGLVNFDPSDNSLIVYTADDGLQSNEFNAGAFYKNSRGEMFFGGINGFNSFYPDSIKINMYIPPVEIVGISVFDERYLPDEDLKDREYIELSHNENHIVFEFAALDFTIPDKNKYAYMLEDVDKDWIYSDFRFANYNNLDPGEYKFRVKGSNSDGVWNEQGTSLKVRIIPPLWLTGWFRFFSVIFIIGMTILAYKIRTRQSRQQRIKLENLVHKRTKDLKEKQDELLDAREKLEIRVEERTRELIAKNLELEKEISERKRFEKELQISEEEYRTLTENVNIGIYRRTKGDDGRIIKVNSTMVEMFGYDSAEELINLKLKNLYDDPEDLVRFNQRMEIIGFASGEEILYKKKDGSSFVGSVTVVAVRDEGGRIKFFDGVIEDITDRKKSEEIRKTLEEQLFQSQKLESIGRLAGGIAHDFNNILTGVMGFAEILKLKFNDPSLIEGQAADVIFTGAERAAELTKQLLGFARAGKYYPVPINMNTIIQDMVRVSEKIFEKRVKVVLDFEEKLNAIEADKNQLEQVVTNLIINAKDAMPDGGELIFKTENVEINDFSKKYPEFKPGKYVRTTVSDSGIGIPNDILDQIFEPFFTTKEEGKGTGLGLSMVYGIIKNHFGYIYVDSHRGKGTSFIIYLPVSTKTVKDVKDETRVLQGNETILVIDDEENVRSLARNQLESLGYQVLLAPDGFTGIKIFKENRNNIDLILLDMIMPEMSGKDTLKLLKKENKDIKVVIISGYSREIISGKNSDMDVLGFIQKPFKLSEISTILSEIFN